ncbi:MAG: KOW motif-containing protein [Planctomycetes bacterium]|nr:KOW motif-containing protein [Planctomycetota bacterium]
MSNAGPFEIGVRVRVVAGPYRGRCGEVHGRREVIAAGAATALAPDASTRSTSWLYDIQSDDTGEMITLGQSLVERCEG